MLFETLTYLYTDLYFLLFYISLPLVLLESAKSRVLRALRAIGPRVPMCPRALVLCVPTCLACPGALRAHIPTCPRALGAHVPLYLACPSVYVGK